MADKPLAGCRILVTRPSAQAGPLLRAIRDAGGDPVAFPVIRIEARPEDDIIAARAALPDPDIAIFVSRNAVESGLRHVSGAGARLAAVGAATAGAIEACGRRADIVPRGGADSENLLSEAALADVDGLNIVIVRGEAGRELLAEELRARGANVYYLPVYRRACERPNAGDIDRVAETLRQGELDFVVALSVETIRCLLALLPAPAERLLRQSTLVAPGERVIQGALEFIPGLDVCRAPGPGADDIVNAMIDRRYAGQ